MKKALALVLAFMMTAAMGVTSFADIPVIDLTEEIGSASGTYIKISDSDIWTAPPSSTGSSATYYTNGVGGVVYFSMIFICFLSILYAIFMYSYVFLCKFIKNYMILLTLTFKT